MFQQYFTYDKLNSGKIMIAVIFFGLSEAMGGDSCRRSCSRIRCKTGWTYTNQPESTTHHDIQVLLICKADQLNVTTNLAESWMHVRTKFDGGKVINQSQSGSWEH